MEFYTKQEVAKLLRVHERTIARWIDTGQMKAYKLGKGKTALLRIAKNEVEKFLEKNKA